MRLYWTDPALRDVENIGDYIAKHNPRAAARVVEAVFAGVDRLVEFPHIGRRGRVAGTRELVVTTTPFVVPYRVKGERIEILAVFYGARRWPESFK